MKTNLLRSLMLSLIVAFALPVFASEDPGATVAATGSDDLQASATITTGTPNGVGCVACDAARRAAAGGRASVANGYFDPNSASGNGATGGSGK